MEKIKSFFAFIALFFTATVIPWAKDRWMEIVNFLIVLLSFGTLMNSNKFGAATLVGLWLTFLLGYYLLWKLFNVESWFDDDEDE